MSQTNGQSVTEQVQPLSQDETQAIFDEIFNATLNGKEVSDRKVDKAIEEARQHVESKQAVVAPVEDTQTQEEVTAETTEATAAEEPAEVPTQTEVVIKPEDYQAVLAEKAKWEQKAKSLDGREAARQRQIQELENKIKQLSQAPAQPKKDVKQAPAKDPRWDALQQADPELAGLLLDLKNEIRQEALREAEQIINQRVEPIYQQQSASYAEREQQRLVEMIPNALEILEHPAYAEWYYRQPDYIQKKANENAESAAAILQMYGYEMSLRYPQTAQEPPKQEASVTDPKVAKLQEERNKRVQVGQVAQKAISTPKQDTFDPNDYFEKQFASHLRKK